MGDKLRYIIRSIGDERHYNAEMRNAFFSLASGYYLYRKKDPHHIGHHVFLEPQEMIGRKVNLFWINNDRIFFMGKKSAKDIIQKGTIEEIDGITREYLDEINEVFQLKVSPYMPNTYQPPSRHTN